jgi:hypothetical protein
MARDLVERRARGQIAVEPRHAPHLTALDEVEDAEVGEERHRDPRDHAHGGFEVQR